MRYVPTGLAVWGILVSAPAAALGAAGAAEKTDLTKVAGVKHFAGTEAARALLARNGFVVTGKQFKQIFVPYIGGPLPKFITTDSAWHTCHVLLEEGVRRPFRWPARAPSPRHP